MTSLSLSLLMSKTRVVVKGSQRSLLALTLSTLAFKKSLQLPLSSYLHAPVYFISPVHTSLASIWAVLIVRRRRRVTGLSRRLVQGAYI